MKLRLIYSSEDIQKNQAYIDLYRRECGRYGIDFSLETHEEFMRVGVGPDIGVQAGRTDPGPADHGDDPKNSAMARRSGDVEDQVVINRSRDAEVARMCEDAGVPVYNSSLISLLGNDKLLCLKYMEGQGIPQLATSVDAGNIGFPLVVKSVDGHGGSEVYLAKDEKELEAARKALSGKRLIYQEVADTPGRDLRVYIVGNRIVGAMLRSSGRDFRANYSLGGKAEVYELKARERGLVEKILSGLTIGHAGIDFLFHKGELYFNELEDVVGSRMLYANTDVDVVKLYMEHILKELGVV